MTETDPILSFLKGVVKTIEENPDEFNLQSPYQFTSGDLIKLMALNQQFGSEFFGHEGFLQLQARITSALIQVRGGKIRGAGITLGESSSGSTQRTSNDG